ncbi:MAG: TonB-dependent receptor [Elusimicrobia bacterium]|nr:TonB-dependent receptor [Elusimicrobiota bacterium]
MKSIRTRWAIVFAGMMGTAGLLQATVDDGEPAKPLFLSVTRRADPMETLPSNISVVPKEEILRSGARTLEEALVLVPSLDVNKTGVLGSFSTVRLRGVPSSAHVQVLVDDQPLGGVSTQFIDVSQIPTDNIERIEVVRGGSSVLYGANTVGGVIHVLTKRHTADRTHSSVGLHMRSFPTEKGVLRRFDTQNYSAHIGARGNLWDGSFFATRYFTDGFQKNSDAKNVSVSGNGGVTFGNGARLTLDLSRSDHDTGDPQGTLVPQPAWEHRQERIPVDPNQRVSQDLNTGRLKAHLPLGAWGSVQSLLYGSDQDYLLFPSPGAAASFEQSNVIVGNDTRLSLPGGFLLGASYERDKQNTVGSLPRHLVDWGLYVQESWSAGTWDFIPAARLDQHSAFGNVVNPRFTAVCRAAENLKLSVNAARSFRAPSFLELYFAGPFFSGNPDLRPETAWSYDLGAQFQPRENMDVSVTGFYTRLRERIAAGPTTYNNSPRAEMRGVEVEVPHRIKSVSSQAGYTFLEAAGNSSTQSRYRPLRLTPKHTAHYRFTWTSSGGWNITNTLRYVHKQFQLDGENGLKLPSMTLWDIRFTKRILAADLYFALDDVTNKRYADAFGSDPATFATTRLPLPGRTFRGGITIRFVD